MPRSKVPRELIASRRARAAKLAKGRETLRKKGSELATLCGVRVAVVCADGEGGAIAEADVWESEGGVLAAYRELPAEVRAAHTHRAYAEAELGKEEAKLARVRLGGPAALTRWDRALDGMGREEVQRVLEDIDAALAAAEARRRELGMTLVPRDDEIGGLLEPIAPSLGLAVAAPACGGSSSNFGGYSLPAQGHGGDTSNGGRYEQAMWTSGNNGLQLCSAATTMQQPGYGFNNPYPGVSGGADMDGYQLQMAVGTNGYGGDSTALGLGLAWDTFQPSSSAGPTRPADYNASQCYYGGVGTSASAGYHTHHVPGNAGCLLQPNPYDAAVPPLGQQHPSLDIGLGYTDNTQGYGSGNFLLNAPPAPTHADNFTNNDPAPQAYPLSISYGGGHPMNASGGYTAQWPAQAQAQQQQQLQSASSSQQSGVDQFFNDLDDTQLQLWGN